MKRVSIVEWLDSLKLERLLTRIRSCTTLFCYIEKLQHFIQNNNNTRHPEFISGSVTKQISRKKSSLAREDLGG